MEGHLFHFKARLCGCHSKWKLSVPSSGYTLCPSQVWMFPGFHPRASPRPCQVPTTIGLTHPSSQVVQF